MTRSQLLAKYTDTDPHQFVQIDGFAEGDGVTGMDADGHGMCGGITTELMKGTDVRVLIPLNADSATTVTLLLKAAIWVEQGAIQQLSKSDTSPIW